jgi:NADH-quinone oxidoreductase subunit J
VTEPASLLAWTSFACLAAVTVGSAVLVVTLRNLFHAVLALIAALLGVAGLYLMLLAEFVAAIHVLIYVGAVATLFLFVIMLTVRIDDAALRQSNRQVIPALALCGVGLALLLAALLAAPWVLVDEIQPPGVQQIGHDMLTTYLLPFEVVSLLLLVALIGAVTLARREDPQP